MAESILKLSDVKLALKRENLNFKVQTSKLNGAEDSIIFIHTCNKTKICGKIVRSFNEGEVRHWPSLNHANIARLIAILCIRDNLCIYLTIHNEITLKNIVHDKIFIYDSRCFDRKRSYAKGIFSGLSYLHGKSLTLMNLCDDNIIISKTHDRAIITNFSYLTNRYKVTKCKLNIPEMYMAPETEKGEFDSKGAEIWASGILMLDMFLAHMVPWAIVNFKPKNAIQIVDKISPELFQAANAGSIVSAMDLTLFRAFLKCFLKQNPLERLPTSVACTASFLQNGDQYETFRDRYATFSFLENTFCIENCNQDLPGVRCLKPTNDSSFNSISRTAQENVETASVTSDVSAIKTQQTKKSFQNCENKTEHLESVRFFDFRGCPNENQNEYLPVNQNFSGNPLNRLLQIQEKEGVIKGNMEGTRESHLYLKTNEMSNIDKNEKTMELDCCRNINKKLKTKGKKKLHHVKKLEGSIGSSFFFTCIGMGGSVEQPMSNADILWETC